MLTGKTVSDKRKWKQKSKKCDLPMEASKVGPQLSSVIFRVALVTRIT